MPHCKGVTEITDDEVVTPTEGLLEELERAEKPSLAARLKALVRRKAPPGPQNPIRPKNIHGCGCGIEDCKGHLGT